MIASPLVGATLSSPDTEVSVMAALVRTDAPDLHITTVRQGSVARTQSDEYVEIVNRSLFQIPLAGWTIDAGDDGRRLTLPSANLRTPAGAAASQLGYGSA
ncbi:hypothetical protein ACGFYZ_21500 [Streptomyces sp. NPDC048330]|uniref:hypothetical protein n=1 Tax=Streptomyces sp. NPDC048330 TaxID=3365533 RepID=UPI00371884B6